MIQNDVSDLIRRGRAASDRLDLAKASGSPFAEISARREGETVLAELKKAVDDDRAKSHKGELWCPPVAL